MPKNEASHSNLTTLFLLRKPEASTIKVKAISLFLQPTLTNNPISQSEARK
jgi:hypothetical protein